MRETVFNYLVEANNTFTGLLDDKEYKRMSLSSNDCIVLDGFLNFLEENYNLRSITSEWIAMYCIFQHKFYLESKEARGKKAVSLFFGRKAIERWLNKSESWYHYIDMQSGDLDFQKIIRYIEKKPKAKLDLTHTYDKERARFKGTSQTLNHCIENTMLYESTSEFCKQCSFQQECAKLKIILYGK